MGRYKQDSGKKPVRQETFANATRTFVDENEKVKGLTGNILASAKIMTNGFSTFKSITYHLSAFLGSSDKRLTQSRSAKVAPDG